MELITYRRLDSAYEPVFGQGQKDYISGKDAVAQSIKTRLNLWLGEWWEDKKEGLPMMQSILGRMSRDRGQASLLIQRRIVGTPYVSSISKVSSSFNLSSRSFTFSCVASITFGGQLSIVGTVGEGSNLFSVTVV